MTLRVEAGHAGGAELERLAVQAGARCRSLRLQLSNEQGHDEYEVESRRLVAPGLLSLTQQARRVPGLRTLSVR